MPPDLKPQELRECARNSIAYLALDGSPGTDHFVLGWERLKGEKLLVEVLDSEGKPLPGFAAKDAMRFQRVDDLRLAPTWKRKLSTLEGKAIRLKFHLENATVSYDDGPGRSTTEAPIRLTPVNLRLKRATDTTQLSGTLAAPGAPSTPLRFTVRWPSSALSPLRAAED